MYSLPLVCIITFLTFNKSSAQQVWRPVRPGQQQDWSTWRPPWYDFHPAVVVETAYGKVDGFSIPWHVDDVVWFPPESQPPTSEYPPWFMKRINCFLGVPYAEPPLGYFRFRRPSPPRWDQTRGWDATYYRHACPQDIEEIRKDIPDYPHQNVSEDCLYLNVFVPNITYVEDDEFIPDKTLYPVIVYIHGGDFTQGTAQKYPGHVLATREVVVVTLNYRLGALGFMSTEDEHAAGNWGLYDQHMALQFIRDNIKAFRGDPNKITLMGSGAGAVSVGLHMVSPMSRDKNFYQQAAMMSGTDLNHFGFVQPFWRPREYAAELAERLGCKMDHPYNTVECLRDNNTITWKRIVDVQSRVKPKDGKLGAVWAPVQDSVIYSQPKDIFMPAVPGDLRRQHMFEKVPTIIGMETDASSILANDSIDTSLEGGLATSTFRAFILDLLDSWKIIDIYRERVWEAVEFQYTFWPDPENRTARGQMFINMVTDLDVGMGLDTVVQAQAEYQPTYMYQFNYKSWNDWAPRYMGVCCSAVDQYVFGFPFLNETVLNETEVFPRQWYDFDDRNMSDWMMYMWTNFVKYGEPTPNITRNITWDPFNPSNLSYLVIDWQSHIWFRYRQDFYGFWKEYFPSLAKQDYLYPTATPTPAGYEYLVATGSMATLFCLLLMGVGLLAFLLWQQQQDEHVEAAYREADTNTLSFVLHSSQSQSSLTGGRKSPGPYPSQQYPHPQYHLPHAAAAAAGDKPTSSRGHGAGKEEYALEPAGGQYQAGYASHPQHPPRQYHPSHTTHSVV